MKIVTKEQVLSYYEKHKRLVSPLFWVVKLTPQTLEHLDKKDRKHARTQKDKHERYKCFLFVHTLVEKSCLYQERKIWDWYEYIKRFWKKEKKIMKVEYFWLIWVVEQTDGYKTRIKVVLKKVKGWNHAELVSVIPAWNAKWYTKMFFEETKKPN